MYTNRRLVFLLCSIVLLLFSLVTSVHAQSTKKNKFYFDRQMKRLIKPFRDAEAFEAMSIAIVYQGRTYYYNYGYTGLDKQKASKNTIYEIASISKVFTGVLLGDAVCRDEAKLDQTLATCMEGLADANPDAAAITLKQLSTHVSGLPRLPYDKRAKDRDNPYADYGRDRVDNFLFNKVKLKHKPGQHYQYSNYAVGLLGDLLARAQQKSFDELLADRITGPLKMRDTSVTIPADRLDRFSVAFLAPGVPTKHWDATAFAGAVGVRSSTTDLVRFIKANIKPPRTPIGKAIELAGQKHQPKIGTSNAMGLGWMLSTNERRRFHAGKSGGYLSYLAIDPQRQIGVVVLTNTSSLSESSKLGDQILSVAYGGDQEPQELKIPMQVSSDLHDRVVGKYQIPKQYTIDIQAGKNSLIVNFGNDRALAAFSESPTDWYFKLDARKFVFDLPSDKSKKAELLTYTTKDGKKLQAVRIE